MLQRLIESHAAANRIAYFETAVGRSLTYRQLVQLRDRLALHLTAALTRGDVVMLRCENRIEYPIWFLAILAAGADVLPVSTELTPSELIDLARRANAKAIVAEENARMPLKETIALQWPIEMAIAPLAPPPVELASVNHPGNLLLASSGTTGQMKIVRRTSQSLDAVAKNMVQAIGFTGDDQVLACVPLTHSYGVEHGLLAPLWAGSTVHLCNGFDLPQVTRALAQGITLWPAVPSMIELLSAVGDSDFAMRSLRAVYSAGGPLPRSVYDRFNARYGVAVGQLYGMTEIGSVTFSSPRDASFNPASVGQPMADVSIRVLNVEKPIGPCENGQEGQIAVRAPSMFNGYVDGPAELIDGHFTTGDLGRLDERGNLVITGRVRLLIDTGGIKVNPAEVETALASHPDVLECVVVPVRQSETVCRLKALVVPRDGSSLPNEAALRAYLRERLAAYKVPRLFEFRDSLPRTGAGKIKRTLLETS